MAKQNIKNAPQAKPAAKPAPKAVAKPAAKVEVKAQPKAAAKPAPKAPVNPVAKTAPKAVAKPAAKVEVKAQPKAAAKPAPKTPAKPAAKTAPKAVAKPVAKVEVKAQPKAAAKPAPKAPVKPAPKAVAKPAAKVEVKAQPKAAAKPAPKAPAKPVATPAPKAAAKPVAKVETKAQPKAAAKPAPKAPAKPAEKPAPKAVAKPEAKVEVKAQPKAAAKPAPIAPAKPATKAEAKPVAKVEAKTSAPAPAKPAPKAAAKPVVQPESQEMEVFDMDEAPKPEPRSKAKGKNLGSNETYTAAVPLVPETKGEYPALIDKRLHQIRFTLEDLKIDAVVVTYGPNVRYLTGFSGSNGDGILFILQEKIIFITDDRYKEQVKTELYNLPNFEYYIDRDPWSFIVKHNLLKGVSTLGFEADRMPYSSAVEKRNQIRPIKFKPGPDKLVERFTQPKSPEELEYLQKACSIAEKVYEIMLGFIKPGMTEKEIAAEIAYQGRKLGAEGDAFDIIAVSGPRSALVHGQPSNKKIKKNEIILLDFGFIVNGFRSDISRTIITGKPTKEQKEMYKLLYEAKEAAVNAVRPGMNGKHLDAISRNMIKKAGFGDYFEHSLGHGLGIEVHENPIITFRREDQIVPEDAVITIEPGIYLPDQYGMRIEDDILVTRNGGKPLTNAPAELVVI